MVMEMCIAQRENPQVVEEIEKQELNIITVMRHTYQKRGILKARRIWYKNVQV